VIVDSSVLVACLKKEDDYESWTRQLHDAKPNLKLSAASYLETSIVIDGSGDDNASANLDLFLDRLLVEIMPVTAKQARLARAAYARFGKGRDHPAKLNFGDCFSYALAIDRDEPLMFKGNDFGHTDVRTI
jgi:ribonuclease VapC